MGGRMVNSRIPVTEETRDELREFVNGLGTTYDDAILFLLDTVKKEGEDALLAGHRLRKEFAVQRKQIGSDLK